MAARSAVRRVKKFGHVTVTHAQVKKAMLSIYMLFLVFRHHLTTERWQKGVFSEKQTECTFHPRWCKSDTSKRTFFLLELTRCIQAFKRQPIFDKETAQTPFLIPTMVFFKDLFSKLSEFSISEYYTDNQINASQVGEV